MMTDDQLSSMGVCTIGERLRLKAFCSPEATTSASQPKTRWKSSEREEKIEKIKEILNSNKRAKRGNDVSSRCPAKAREKETLKFDFGWKHWVDGKYKLRRADRGGGKRRAEVARHAGYDECLQIAKPFFFPKGVSDAGNEEEMYFVLADNNSVDVETLEDEFSTIPFSAHKYKELTGFTLPSLYLLSRSKCSMDDDNSDTDTYLCEPVFEITPIDDEGNDVPSQSSTLLGSSEERRAFFQELERQASESAAMDIAKEAEREAKENERRKRIEDEIAKAETEAKALERLRKARELRVPPEPDSTHPRVVLSVRHLHLGVIKRAFVSTDTVSAVYDWVGSKTLRFV